MTRRHSALPLAVAAIMLMGARPTSGLRTTSDPIWGVSLRAPGYQPASHPLSGQADFILAGSAVSGSCRMNLSMFAAPTRDGATPDECRQGGVGDPDALDARQDTTLVDQKEAPIAYSLFDQTFESRQGPKTSFHQLYGYFTRGDLCFELHISGGETCPGFKEKAEEILRSVRIEKESGATLETVELAKRKGGDPRDWRLHMLVAEAYLREEDHRNPARARRFYASALRLGGKRIPLVDRFAIEHGIGLTWLAEDNGGEAIPYLMRALQAAHRAGGSLPPEQSRGVLYSLASAHAMAGDLEASCDYAQQWLKAQDASDLKPAARRIRKDPQMTALNGSDCYQSALTDLGLR